MKLIFIFIFAIIFMSFFASAEEVNPMILRNIKEVKSVNPADVANLGFGVYQVSAQYNIGSYQSGKWYGNENKKAEDKKSGALWIEFSWERPETDIVLIDGLGNERKIYLPASKPKGNSTYGEYYWIAEDGSSYYATKNHARGWADLSYNEALVSEHLARKSLSPDQKNPENEEPEDKGIQDGDIGLIKVKGQLVDQMTGTVISGAKLSSAYEFSPKEVMTDSNGNFEFSVRSGQTWAGAFYDYCHGWAGNIALQKDHQVWENGQLVKTYALGLVKEKFDSKAEVIEVSGKNEFDMGKVYSWPAADIYSESDINSDFFIMYKYKNSEGYNGPGNGNFRKQHSLSDALPLDYEVYIAFKDEQGKTYKSSTYRVPKEVGCGVVSLKFINGESKWSILEKVEPTEKTGPIKIDVPEVIEEEKQDTVSNLCSGCLKGDTCYPFGFRKEGNFCSDTDNAFILQFEADAKCENNFECGSNVCVSGKCIAPGLIDSILNWFKRLFG